MVTPFRALITLLVISLLSPLPLQVHPASCGRNPLMPNTFGSEAQRF